MNVVQIITRIIEEYLQKKGLSNMEIATIESINPISIKLANDKILPIEFLTFNNNMRYLKNTLNDMEVNSKIIVQKALGGQQYFILDKYQDESMGNSISIVTNINPLEITLRNGKILKNKEFMIFSKSLEYLINTTDEDNKYKKIITLKETGTDKYIFLAESV